MAGRRTQLQKIRQYITLIEDARQRGDKNEELRHLKEWVGTAKVTLSIEQQVQVLFLIYGQILPTPTATDFLFDTYKSLFSIEDIAIQESKPRGNLRFLQEN